LAGSRRHFVPGIARFQRERPRAYPFAAGAGSVLRPTVMRRRF